VLSNARRFVGGGAVMQETALQYITEYGYIFLFTWLVLELIVLPLPGQVLMSYTGYLVYLGRLDWGTSILVACGGVCTGITVGYLLGLQLGAPFFHRYGHYVYLGPARLRQVARWFDKYGQKLLIFAYFIPGVRHITGYFAGVIELPYPVFALRAYLGAIIWTTTFISFGRILGPGWERLYHLLERYFTIAGVLVVLFSLGYLWRKRRLPVK